jgi:hypothetical protein
MMRRRFGYTLSLVLASLTLAGGPAFAEGSGRAVSKIGSLAGTFLGGMETLRMSNAEGEMAEFDATTFGLRIGIRPAQDLLPGFSLFFEGSMTDGKNASNSHEDLEVTTFKYGATQYVASIFFIGGYIGSRAVEATLKGAPAEEVDSKASVTGIGLGVDLLKVGDSLAMSLEVWNHSGHALKSDDQPHNMGVSSIEYYIGIRWSPTVTIAW